MRYIAFIHKDPDSIYGVSFPDVPGCFSAGDTIDEAVHNAVEALSGHIRMLEADGDPVPRPRDFDAIMNDPELAEDRYGAMTTIVPLVRDRGSNTRINVSSTSVCSRRSTPLPVNAARRAPPSLHRPLDEKSSTES